MLNKILLSKLSLLVIFVSVLNMLCPVSNSEPVLMIQSVGQQIFQQHIPFLIYVYDQPSPKVQLLFNEYCQGRTNCTILNSTVQEYESVRKFIGKKQNEFFLILNVPFHKKYILQVNPQTLTRNDLQNFERGFEQQKLQPFYASEPIPQNNSNVCRQLVGKTYADFLKQPATLKVVYTYTKHQACAGCIPMLKEFIKLAQGMPPNDIIKFGYVDVFLNDLPKIRQPLVPHFYIYKEKQIIKQIDEADWEDLPQIIKSQVRKIIPNPLDDDQDSSSSDISNQEQL